MLIHSAEITGSVQFNNTDVSGITNIAGFATTASVNTLIVRTGSYASTSSVNELQSKTGSYTSTSSFGAYSSSINTFTSSATTRLNTIESVTGSYATTGSNQFNGNQSISGSITSNGTITAQTLVVQTITSSIEFVTGSTRNGSLLTNTHQFTGSVNITGSLTVSSSISTTENINMGSPFMFRNKVMNGAMTVDQRNNGSAITADGYPVDRFIIYEDGAQFTMQRSTTVPTGAGFTNSLSITVGTGQAVSSGNYTTIRHGIEGINTGDLAWGTANAKNITVSFWVRSSLTGNFGLALRNNANNYGYVASYNIPSADTWTYITTTIPGPTSGTWSTAVATRGINLIWDLGAGTSYSIAAGSWTSSAEILGLTGGTKLKATTGAIFYLTGVQLEIGNIATPFEHKPYATELQLCKRFFQKWGNGIMWQAGNTGASGGANDYFKMLGGGNYNGGEMASIPTLAYLNDVYFMGVGGLSGSPSDLGTIAAANMGSLSLNNTTTAINRLGIFNITTYGGTRGWYYAATDPFVGLTAEIST
jgi:hypothetical protein